MEPHIPPLWYVVCVLRSYNDGYDITWHPRYQRWVVVK